MNRRRFLKYAGTTAAVVGGSALGLDYVLAPRSTTLNRTGIISTSSTLVRDTTPPVIGDFQWQPTRVVNGKVYDGTVSYVVEDAASSVAEAQLDFDPVYPPEIPRAAIPDESSRSYVFVVTQKNESFTQTLTDLKGGKQYNAVAKVKDQAGNETSSSLDVPYVREFENIAGLDDVTVIADYYVWYDRAGGSWRSENGEVVHLQTPVLGEYSSDDQAVISKHIDWATGHGIDAFCLDTDELSESNSSNIQAFLANPLVSNMQFCLIYGDYGRLEKRRVYDYDRVNGTEIIQIDDPDNMRTLVADFSSWQGDTSTTRIS